MVDKRLVFSLLLGLSASACGIVSGLSDDYTFERDAEADAELPSEAAAPSDAATQDGATPRDARPPVQDGATEDAGCAVTSAPPDVSLACATCLTTKCCAQIRACSLPAVGQRCNDYLKCVDGCARSNDACYTNCRNTIGGVADAPARALDSCATSNGCVPEQCHR